MLDKTASMQKLEKSISSCRKCRLCETATNAVPGEGNVNSKLVFIGEAPGEQEDRTGRPFVGRAGMLLEKTLVKIGYQRSDVWIGNIIKHRPPNNRDPLQDEIEACQGYLFMQLRIIAPVLIVTLGRYAMNYFYPQGKISSDRGRVIDTAEYKVYPVYHPAAALRNPTMMKDFLRDFVQIPKVLASLEKTTYPISKESNSIDAGEVRKDSQLGLNL